MPSVPTLRTTTKPRSFPTRLERAGLWAGPLCFRGMGDTLELGRRRERAQRRPETVFEGSRWGVRQGTTTQGRPASRSDALEPPWGLPGQLRSPWEGANGGPPWLPPGLWLMDLCDQLTDACTGPSEGYRPGVLGAPASLSSEPPARAFVFLDFVLEPD